MKPESFSHIFVFRLLGGNYSDVILYHGLLSFISLRREILHKFLFTMLWCSSFFIHTFLKTHKNSTWHKNNARLNLNLPCSSLIVYYRCDTAQHTISTTSENNIMIWTITTGLLKILYYNNTNNTVTMEPKARDKDKSVSYWSCIKV